MVNGPGTVIFTVWSVCFFRNSTSRTPTGRGRTIGPATLGTGWGCPLRSRAVPRVVDVDALEGGGEAVAVGLAQHLAVGDDVEAGLLLGPDSQDPGVVLGLLQILRLDPPQLQSAHPRREPAGELGPVHQPVRLGIAAHQGGRADREWNGAFGHAPAPRTREEGVLVPR
jgi:hypothetical protein